MSSLTFTVLEDGSIALPALALVDSPLTLVQLGAIVVVAAISEGVIPLHHDRMAQPETLEAINSLREHGVLSTDLTHTDKGMRIDIKIDLEKLK